MATDRLSAARAETDNLVDRWFRALDQQTIRIGVREWLIQVTGIHVDNGDIWIQIADAPNQGTSILLHVSASTPVEHALRALARRERTPGLRTYPAIVTATFSGAQQHERYAASVGGAN